MSEIEQVIVLLSGDGQPSCLPDIRPDAYVIAADGGLALAAPLGLVPNVVVGDMDSVEAEALERAESSGAVLQRHPTDKDCTDLELALQHAAEVGARRVDVLGGSGGRVDHHLANVACLGTDLLAEAVVVAHLGMARLSIVRSTTRLDGDPHSLVSLLALGAPAHGVCTDGLRWTLRDETLTPTSSRGVSNELLGNSATVSIASGVVLAVQPDATSARALSR